jgi:nicotinate-nucleotide adenylyltransferase
MSDPTVGNQARERVVIFGGAFDPFHNGHVAVIKLLLRLANIKQVVVVPSGERPDKLALSAAVDRLNICKLGVAANFRESAKVSVSDAQVSGVAQFSSIDLARYFKVVYPDSEIVCVIGSELIKDLPNWYMAAELKYEVSFIVVKRPGDKTDSKLDSDWRLEWLPDLGELAIDVSSTELRRRLASGDPCAGLLPAEVARYCLERGVYRGR